MTIAVGKPHSCPMAPPELAMYSGKGGSALRIFDTVRDILFCPWCGMCLVEGEQPVVEHGTLVWGSPEVEFLTIGGLMPDVNVLLEMFRTNKLWLTLIRKRAGGEMT